MNKWSDVGLGALAAFLAFLVACGCGRQRVERVEWTVMDTVAAVQWKTGAGVDGKRLAAAARGVFGKVEGLLNAFDPESELSRLAKLPDGEVLATCDPLVRPCYVAAFRLRDETGGVFNPRWRGPGTMDLGAIAKGFAVDLAAKELAKSCGETEVLVDLGGNLKAVSGTWTTAIESPTEAERTAGRVDDRPDFFVLRPGMACATSAEYFRGHHIKDGRDGSDTKGGVASVTIVHPDSAMLADGLSTVMFLLGRVEGEAFLRAHYPTVKTVWIGGDER